MVYLLFIVIKSFVVLIASYVEVLKVNSVVPDAVDLIIYLDHRCFRYYNFRWKKKTNSFYRFCCNKSREAVCLFGLYFKNAFSM